MVQLSEDSNFPISLVSILYLVRPVIPKSYGNVLYPLSPLRLSYLTRVIRCCFCSQHVRSTTYNSSDDRLTALRSAACLGKFPVPSTKGAEAFGAYIIASKNGLIPEMKMQPTLNIPRRLKFLEKAYDGSRVGHAQPLPRQTRGVLRIVSPTWTTPD